MKNLETILKDFESTLHRSIDEAWFVTDSAKHLNALAEQSELLTKAMLEVGDFAATQLEAGDQKATIEETLVYYIINFLWAERAKFFLILWRDIIFQRQKGQALLLDGQTTEGALTALHQKSKGTLRAAADDLLQYIEEDIAITRRSRTGKDGCIAAWKLQQNPWPIYRAQIADLPQQCQQLVKDFEQLQIVTTLFNRIGGLIQHTCLLYTSPSPRDS